MCNPSKSRAVSMACAILCLWTFQSQAQSNSNQIIYDDSLENGWENWSWADVNLSNARPAHSGHDSIAVTESGYTALYLEHSPFPTTSWGYTNLSFWINGGASGGQVITVQGTLGGVLQSASYVFTLKTNVWQQISIPLATLGVANQLDFDGFYIWNFSNNSIPTFYVDDITLLAGPLPPPALNHLTVDAAASRHPISSLIYGTAWAPSNQLSDLNFTDNRGGGNEETTYNWQDGVHGKGSDWYFEAIPDSPPTPGASMDGLIADSQAAGALALVTIPIIGWTPTLGTNRSTIWSYSIAKYGPQTGHDPYSPDAGNGTSVTNNTPITWNDPTDAYKPTDTNFQMGYLQHLTNNWGLSTQGGVRYYVLDNEHSIWHSTHQDIHPIGATMTEVRDKMLATASLVKGVDPSALVLGPEEWGWPGYLYSGFDQQWSSQNGGSPTNFPDRQANGGWDYMPWLLNQFYQHDTNTGRRLLDYFTLHCYPQGGEDSDDISVATELLRNRSTRQLWDTNYVDDSWIGAVVSLIPRMKGWVSTNYPDTKIGVTEYNWGAEASLNGATAQADILGIFGREGLDLATRWTVPNTGTPAYEAMKIYRNYDGHNSAFGDTSVSATAEQTDNVAIFAAQRSLDGTLTIMVVSKYLFGTAPLNISLAHFASSGSAQVWQISSNNPSGIQRLSDLAYQAAVLNTTVPGPSITLFVLSSNSLVSSTNQMPKIIFQPTAPAKVIAGTNVSLSVKATGTGPLFYQWQVNSAPIPGTTAGNYSFLAQPVSGSTNLSYAVAISNAAGFVLSSNASLMVLPDTATPTVTISSPTANARTNKVNLAGTATDKVAVSVVTYALTNVNNGVKTVTNGNAVLAAGLASSQTVHWTIAALPWPGSNTLAVQSFNYSGRHSTAAVQSFFYVAPSQLALTPAGTGTGTFSGTASIHGDALPANGAWLNTGESYTVTARAGANSLFAGWWTNSAPAGANATLNFVMEPGLAIQGAFLTNLFPAAAGAYNGLFLTSNAVTEATAGMLRNLALTATGAFSAQLLLAGTTNPFTGAFNPAGQSSNSILRSASRGGPLTVQLTLTGSTAPFTITGSVAGGTNPAWSSPLYAQAAAAATPSAEYTLLILPGPSAPAAPPGDGYALITNHAGSVTLNGALADGATFSQTVPVSPDGDLPLYAGLYTNTGLLLGWINLAHLNSAPPLGGLAWLRPAHAGALNIGAFTNYVAVQGWAWTNPPARQAALALTNGQLQISGGALAAPLNFNVTRNSSNSLVTSSNSPIGTVNPKTGQVTLTFVSGPRQTNTCQGAALQDTASAGGFFLTTTNAGAFLLQP